MQTLNLASLNHFMPLHGHCVLVLFIWTEPQEESSPTYTIPSAFIHISLSAQKDTLIYFPTSSIFNLFNIYLVSSSREPSLNFTDDSLDLLDCNRTPVTNQPKPPATELLPHTPTSGLIIIFVCILWGTLGPHGRRTNSYELFSDLYLRTAAQHMCENTNAHGRAHTGKIHVIKKYTKQM